MSSFFSVIFIIPLIAASDLQKVFTKLPALELKRRARRGNFDSKRLYKLAAHGANLRLLLWLAVVVFGALAFVSLGEALSFWPAFVIILVLVWLGFVWLPASQVSDFELIVTGFLAPPLGRLLAWLYAPLASLGRLIKQYQPVDFHTGLYEKSDLLKLLAAQKQQSDNRIDQEALDLAIRGLSFGDRFVEDYMIPRSHVKTVESSDSASPKLIDELHKSGQKIFLVVEGRPERTVGTLRLEDLVDLRNSGSIKSLMQPKVFYIHEDFALAQVLDAFYKTHHHLFIVVNKFEDFVGVITIEDVLEQIIGETILSDFDDYDSAEAVAKHIAREAAGSEPQEGDLVAEVVEDAPEVVK